MVAERVKQGERQAGRTRLSAFNTLYERALADHPELNAVLVENGFDPAHPEADYPSEVWSRCLEAARQALYGDLPIGEGMRELGRRFANGFANSPFGVVHSGVRYTAEGYIRRLPFLLSLARPDLESEVVFETERCWRLIVRGEVLHPDFMSGLVEARLQERGMPARVSVAQSGEGAYHLRLSW